MTELSSEELRTRHRELVEKREDLWRRRASFVMEETERRTSERDDMSGMFAKSSVRKLDPDSPLNRDRSRERITAINEVLEEVENSTPYQELEEEIEAVDEELDKVWAGVEEIVVDNERNKKENIGRIWSVLGSDIDTRRLVDAVDCHPQYPGRLEFDPDSGTALYKERVVRRKENQVRPDHRQEILERDGQACIRCGHGDSADLTVHHIIPVSQNGEAIDSNLVTLCDQCHRQAHQHSSKGSVFYEGKAEFWGWVKNGARGFIPV